MAKKVTNVLKLIAVAGIILIAFFFILMVTDAISGADMQNAFFKIIEILIAISFVSIATTYILGGKK